MILQSPRWMHLLPLFFTHRGSASAVCQDLCWNWLRAKLLRFTSLFSSNVGIHIHIWTKCVNPVVVAAVVVVVVVVAGAGAGAGAGALPPCSYRCWPAKLMRPFWTVPSSSEWSMFLGISPPLNSRSFGTYSHFLKINGWEDDEHFRNLSPVISPLSLLVTNWSNLGGIRTLSGSGISSKTDENFSPVNLWQCWKKRDGSTRCASTESLKVEL